MKRLFLISFDERSDQLVRRVVGIVGGLDYDLNYRLSSDVGYSTIEGERPAGPEPTGQALPEPDGLNNLQRSLHPLEQRPRQSVNPLLLSERDATLLEALEEPMTSGDLVMFFTDIFHRESHALVFYLSEKAMSRRTLSLCFLHRDDQPLKFNDLEELNKDYLRFNLHFNGVVGLSPRIAGGGLFIELANLVRNLAHFSFRPGLVNLDQADLLVTSKGGTVLVMTYGTEQPGGNPASTSARDALENPICDVDLTSVRKALVSITGGEGLTVEDSLVAAEYLKRRIRKEARIIWGVTVIPDPDEEMEVFLVLATTPMELLTHWYSRGA